MTLHLRAGHCSLMGPRTRNEDFVGLVMPGGAELARKGICAVVADGVSGSSDGREAAEYCGRNLLADYYSTPDTWEISQSLERIYAAQNRWLVAQARSRPDDAGLASTLTSLVLRGATYHFAHVGDTRLYLLRAGNLQQLTADHVWERPEMRHVLKRGMGLDTSVTVDHGMGPLQAGDVLLLVSDGVWAPMAETDLHTLLARATDKRADCEKVARSLCESALTLGGQDNASALVIAVDSVDSSNLHDLFSHQTDLPVPLLAPGQQIDGLTVLEVIHSSRVTRLYRVQEGAGRFLVLKTLSPQAAEDAHERLALIHEAWLARRVTARFFAQAVEPPQPATALYFLTTWHAGDTLGALLGRGRHFTVPEAVRIGSELARALGALHRRSIVHRDIKPDNILLDANEKLIVLDLGVAVSGFDTGELHAATRAGTPSYLAPELFLDGVPSPASDLYAWGVTLYQLLTQRYPYGEIEPFQQPRFGAAVPISRTRPDVPGWLEAVILRALEPDPGKRFETAEELLLAIERGPLQRSAPLRHRPLATRNQLLTWRLVAGLSILLNLGLLWRLLG